MLRLAVPGLKRLLAERPTAVRDPGTVLKIDFIQLRRAPAPNRRGTAKKSKPGVGQRVIFNADAVAGGQILNFGVEILAARFQQ